jgi:tetratricopeptide (TPR) repeat protein
MHVRPGRDLTIVGDFVGYFIWLVVPLFLVGGIYGVYNDAFFVCGLVNPLIYSIGISLIIIVVTHDLNDILILVGLGKETQLSLNLKHAKTIQQIACLMAAGDYDVALKSVKALLLEAPDFANALSLKGQILLQGFRKNKEARACFEKVLALTKPDEEQFRLADALIAASYDAQDSQE